MNEIYLTTDEAEEILMAVEVGVYNLDYPGNKSKLAHAKLLMASQQAVSVDRVGRAACRECGGNHLTVDCNDTAWFFPPGN